MRLWGQLGNLTNQLANKGGLTFVVSNQLQGGRQANLTFIRHPQLHLPNLYVEGEGEPVDVEF
jgi:hypothetical protein